MNKIEQKERLKQAGGKLAAALLESLVSGFLHASAAIAKEVGNSLIKSANEMCKDKSPQSHLQALPGDNAAIASSECNRADVVITNVTTKKI